MHVPKELVQYINEKGIETIVEKTSRAVELYNLKKTPEKAAALHITC